jgi:predicted AlkP superfamily pyrophosphatase or phosphodiesterase
VRFSVRLLSATASLFLVLTLASGCAGEREAEPRILFIGVDGLEWSVLAPMVRNGEAPHLRSLMERGVYGRLETMEPTLSPVIWTTIGTGKVPEKHGVENFVDLDPGTGEARLYNRLDRKVKAFWNILSEKGDRVHVVGWFVTYPAEPIRGFMVSQYTTLSRAKELWKGSLHEGVPDQTYPQSFYQELVPDIRHVAETSPALTDRVFGEGALDPSLGLEARLVQHTLWALESDVLYARIAERILKSDPDFDVLAVYFGGPDVAGHRFWRYYRPDEFRFPPPRERLDRFGEVVPTVYRMIDEWVGRLLALCGDDVTVFVVSDHGMSAINQNTHFESLERVQQMNSGHHLEAARSPGVIIAAGPGIRRDRSRDPSRVQPLLLDRMGSVLDVTPTLLYLRHSPVGNDMDGGLLEKILDPQYLRDHPLESIETHESAGAREEGDSLDQAMEEEMMERFRALGYIE